MSNGDPYYAAGGYQTATATAITTPVYTPPRTDTAAEQKQAALDFVLWLNGAMDVMDATPPTQAQWDLIRGKIAGQIASIVAQRIRKAAEPNPQPAAEQALKARNLAMQSEIDKDLNQFKLKAMYK